MVGIEVVDRCKRWKLNKYLILLNFILWNRARERMLENKKNQLSIKLNIKSKKYTWHLLIIII